MATLDRSEINRALAKAIAYKQCGKEQDAEAWALRLVELLGVSAILHPDAARYLKARVSLQVEG